MAMVTTRMSAATMMMTPRGSRLTSTKAPSIRYGVSATIPSTRRLTDYPATATEPESHWR